MFGIDRRRPYPWDLQLDHPSLERPVGVRLASSGGTKLLRRQRTGFENVTPTDYSYSNQSPFSRRTTRWPRLVMGMGQPVQTDPDSQRYDHAMGVDWSCGLGVLATSFVTPMQIGTGPIKDIKQMTIAGTRWLFVLSGNRLYKANAATIDDPTDFTLVLDFGTWGATPAAPTHTIVGATGATTIHYKIAYNSQFSGGSPPSVVNSLPSASLVVTNANAALDATHRVDLTWAASPNGLGTELYKSTDGGATWNWGGHFAAGVTSYHDDGSAMIPVAGLPTLASFQTPYQLWAGYYTTPTLFVGVDSGSYWVYDGSAWTQASDDGRSITQHVFNAYRNSRHNADSTRTGINVVYTSTDIPWLGSTGGGSPQWTSVFADGGQDTVTKIAIVNGAVVVCEEGKISVGTNDVTPERSSAPHADNGRCATIWLGSLYVPYGMGWYKVTPTGANSAVVESVGVERLIENSSVVHGRVTASVGWGAWHLFCAIYDEVANVSYLGKYGAWVNPEEARQSNSALIPVLHAALESWNKKATWMEISSIGEPSGNPRLYVGFSDGYVTWSILPRQGPFAPNDPSCVFRATGYTVLSRHTMGYQADPKTFYDFTAWGPMLSNSLRARIAYYLEGVTSQFQLPDLITESGQLVVLQSGTSAKWIQPVIYLDSDVPGDSPVLEGIGLHEQLKPAFVEEMSFTALTEPLQKLRHGHPIRNSGATLLRTLRDLAAYGDEVTALLPGGERRTVAVMGAEDHLLPGNDQAAEQHAVAFTLAEFQALTPSTA